MKSRGVTTLVLGGLFAVVASSAGLAATTPLTYTPTAGDRFVYSRMTVETSTDGVHHHHLGYAITVDGPSSGTLVKSSSDRSTSDVRGLGTYKVQLNGGAWTLADGSAQYDFGYDPRLYCPVPPTIAPGASWDCSTSGITHWLPAGHVSIRVSSMAGNRIVLDVAGSSSPVNAAHVDNDTGAQYESVETTRWREHLVFANGVLQENTRDSVDDIDIANLNLTSREHTVITLVPPSP